MRRAFLRGLGILLFACAAAPAAADGITVFAADGLRNALEAVRKAFEAKSGHELAVSYGNPVTLAGHIRNGVPADVFLSDAASPLDDLERQQMLVPGSRRTLLVTDLVLIAPVSSTAEVRLAPGVDLAKALAGGKIVMAHPDKTVAGRHARAALTATGSWNAAVVTRIAAAPSGRVAVDAVAKAQYPFGIAYRSEALANPGVRVVATFPPASHPPIEFAVAQVARMSPPSAFELADFLASREALAIFERFGFRAPS